MTSILTIDTSTAPEKLGVDGDCEDSDIEKAEISSPNDDSAYDDLDASQFSETMSGGPLSPDGSYLGRSSRGKWTAEEDEILRNAVQKHGGRNWKKISDCLEGRTDVQCLHRWQKVLRPGLIKGPWTKEVRSHTYPENLS
jgi:hypothetical protein